MSKKPAKNTMILFGGAASEMTLFDYFLAHAPLPPTWFKWPYRTKREGEDSGQYEQDYQFSRLLGWRQVYAERMVSISAMGKQNIVSKFNGPWGDLAAVQTELKKIHHMREKANVPKEGAGKEKE